MTDPWDQALRSALAPARKMEPTDEELRRALAIGGARVSSRNRRRARLAIAGCVAIAVGTALQTVSPTRAAIEDVYGNLSSWLGSDDDNLAPGRPLGAGEDMPAWIRDTVGDKRLIAESGDVKLFAARASDGQLSIALSDSVGLTDSADGWRRQLADHRVVLLGTSSFPGNRHLDEQGRRPLYGLTSGSVARVELRYATGAPTTADGLDGGFVMLADAHRKPRTMVAFDAAGTVIESDDVSSLELRVCTDVRGCPPGRFKP